MSILSTRAAPSKARTRPHDLDVCGLGFASDCDTCRAAGLRGEHHFVEREDEARSRSRRREIIGRLAILIDCPPAELVELLVEIALHAQGGAA